MVLPTPSFQKPTSLTKQQKQAIIIGGVLGFVVLVIWFLGIFSGEPTDEEVRDEIRQTSGYLFEVGLRMSRCPWTPAHTWVGEVSDRFNDFNSIQYPDSNAEMMDMLEDINRKLRQADLRLAAEGC